MIRKLEWALGIIRDFTHFYKVTIIGHIGQYLISAALCNKTQIYQSLMKNSLLISCHVFLRGILWKI